MNRPKVSAVVPVYNVENFIELCIDSALKQTLKDIEIICVDDGSTDSSGKILDEYAEKDSRVKVIHKKNEGYGVAMNTGIKAATGEYFAVLESDDFIAPNMYETLYETAKKFDADVVRSNYYDLTTSDGKINLEPQFVTSDSKYQNRLICPNKEKEVYTFVMHNWTGIYKISFLNEKGIRYNTTPGASYQDNGFFFQVFSQTEKLVYIPEHFYAYRIDNPGSSINNPQKVYAMTEEFGFIKDKLENIGLFESLQEVYYNRLFRAYHQTYQRISKELKAEYLEFYRHALIDANDKMDWSLFDDWQNYIFKLLLKSKHDYKNVVAVNKTPYQYAVALKCRIKKKLNLL